MYLTLIYRDEYVRPDFPKKQFFTISNDLTTIEIQNLINCWKLNPFIENFYLNVSKEFKSSEKTNNFNSD